MNNALRKIAVLMGVVLLIISIKWSKDGFNFSVAGDAGGTQTAILIGYAIALAGTVVQFVFSTSLKELNPSLLVFGAMAYGYSIYTNKEGIISFQGTDPNEVMAWVLGFCMDGVPEPLIAWGLHESLSGDFVGNLFGGVGNWFVSGSPAGKNGGQQKQQQSQQQQKQHQPQNNHKGGQARREELARMYHGEDRRSKPQGRSASLQALEAYKQMQEDGELDQ